MERQEKINDLYAKGIVVLFGNSDFPISFSHYPGQLITEKIKILINTITRLEWEIAKKTCELENLKYTNEAGKLSN